MRRIGTAGGRIVGAGAAAALLSGLVSAVPAVASAAHPATTHHAKARLAAHVYQTPGQASAQAVRTGKAVPVTGATTANSTTIAEPNGTFSMTASAGPVRAKVDGVWRSLNADLKRNRNGSYSPAVSSEPLILSGGGTEPLATMKSGVYSLAFTAPMRLPAPVIIGNTANYRSVLPGVNLIVTAEASGGFSDVLEIRNAAAAANPALKALTFGARTQGITLRSGRGGIITALGRNGAVIFAAPAPRMWDSGAKPGLKTVMISGVGRLDRATGLPAASTVTGPGYGARTAPLRVQIRGDRITLIPDRSLLTGTGPYYLDPSWIPAGGAASSWAYVSSDYRTQQYYNVDDYLQVGKNPGTGGTSYSFYTLPIPPQIKGATIDSATAYFPEVWSDSCTASPVDLYETGAIHGTSSGNPTTWDNQPTWGPKLGSDNVAYGWSSQGYPGGSSSCGYSAKDVSFSGSALVNEIVNDALPGNWPSLTVGLKAQDTSDSLGWKLFANNNTGGSQNGYPGIKANATWTINYAHAPSTPALSTSPTADCTNGSSTLGNGTVTLNAKVSDQDGSNLNGGLTVNFDVYAAGKTSDGIENKNVALGSHVAPGLIAPLLLSQSSLDSAVASYGSNGQVKVTWTATASATGLTGVPAKSATCSFTFSDAIPGQPVVLDSTGAACGTGNVSYSVGTASSFSLEANASATIAPTSYTYQLNGGNPVTVTAGKSSPYTATASIVPTRFTNVLIVNAVAVSGNIGQSSYCTFNAAAPAPAAGQDMTGDGIPDLLAVGNGTTGTASGLWLADGQSSGGRFDGTVDPTASDIAPNGPQDVGTPSSWNGLRALSGQFTDNGFNDIEAYQPGTANVYVLPGQGDGSATTSDEQNLTGVFADTSQVSGNTNYPQQLVSAYSVSANGGTAQPYPDQVGVFTDANSSVGSYLGYFANSDGFNSFDAGNFSGLPFELTNTTPDGSMDWNNWTVSTDQDTRGGTAYTDMWLWNSQTGGLYLWELTGLANQTAGGVDPVTFSAVNPTATLTYTQTQVSAAWNQGVSLATFQATDVYGNPGFVTVTGSGQVQSYAYSGSSLTQVNAGGPSQSLLTATHNYPLNDGTTGVAAVAADQAAAGVTAQQLTGNSGTTWNNGDMFSPDVKFNGSSGYMITGTQSGVFTPSKSFTISAWVDPAKLGGMVFSQNGSSNSTVEVSSTTSGAWSVSMDTGTGSSYVSVSGGTAHAGMWTNLTVTFDAVGGADILKLYADGVEVATTVDDSPQSTTGKFVLGANQVNGVTANFFSGQIADVQVWDSLATPVQPGSPASVFVPVTPVRIVDTRSASKIGPITGPVAARSTIDIPIDGNTIASIPASGVTAIAMSVTVTNQSAGGFLTVYPAGTPLPTTSTVNFVSTGDATNNTIVPVGPDGDIAIWNSSTSSVQLVVDLTGYFTSNTGAAGASTYTPLGTPTRILDTRVGTGAPKAAIAANGTLTLTMAGDNTNGAGVPSTGLTAVALNLTASPLDSGDSGHLTAYPDGIARPNATSLTYMGTNDQSQAGTIIIPVGSDGKIDVYNQSGTPVNVVGDLSGYFTTSTSGEYYHSLDSTRIIDTRQTSALAANSGITIANPNNILANNPSLILNITVTQAAAGGYLQAYPGGAARPQASILDFISNQDDANLAVVNTASANSFTIYNSSGGTAQVAVDTNGYFA